MKAVANTPFRYTTKSGAVLTESETNFVNKYLETRGDRVEAVTYAYNIDETKKGWYQTARAMAYKLLSSVHITEAIREIMDKKVLNSEIVDQELAFVIEQHAELSPKVAAINEYNKITGRHAAEKHKHEFAGVDNEKLREDLARIIAEGLSNSQGTTT